MRVKTQKDDTNEAFVHQFLGFLCLLILISCAFGVRNSELPPLSIVEKLVPLPADILKTCEGSFLVEYISNSHVLNQNDLTFIARYSIFDSTLMQLNGRNRFRLFHKDDRIICGLALLYQNNCDEASDSILSCLRKLGSSNLELIIPSRCSSTSYFMELIGVVNLIDEKCGAPTSRLAADKLRLGLIEQDKLIGHGEGLPAPVLDLISQSNEGFLERVLKDGSFSSKEEEILRKTYYVPPEMRPSNNMPNPLQCGNYKVHPIGYALTRRPSDLTYPERKLFEFFPINPAMFRSKRRWGEVADPYLFKGKKRITDEWLYATLMRYSMFAFTHQRGGWDCLRHHEIIRYGAVPVFPDLKVAPWRTSSTTPRDLLLKVLEEPMISLIGHLEHDVSDLSYSIVLKGKVVKQTNFFRRCWTRCNIDFINCGRINLEPYRKEHEQDQDAGVVAHGAPLTFQSPVIKRHYQKLARPLWDLFNEKYTAASMMSYVLKTTQYQEPRRVLVIGCTWFDSDYLHESVMVGLSDLGIRTEVLVEFEADKFQRFSAKGLHSDTKKWLIQRGYIGDVREVGIKRVERQNAALHTEYSYSFSSKGRLNPFVISRIGNAHHLPKSEQFRVFSKDVANLDERIRRGDFDMVIYSLVRSEIRYGDYSVLPLYSTVCNHLPKKQIVFMNHNDIDEKGTFETTMPMILDPRGTVFVRESLGRCE
ncbi:unnamed protein product [Phytomonas sp. Hart1]|nr:unnamed protein product [Phytomonas sp. Hart1]|eukprot:CCW72277.1 unnamed protein product [Phytomonas sp. isolate Hart1]